MSVNLITGNLFSPIQASQDSDYQAGTFGEKTQILNVGSKMAVSIVDNSTIRCEDGVLVTREGRRVQIDNGDVVEWTIPTGTQGTTSYYIVGFRLYTDDESAQLCDTFVQSVAGPGATITEDTFRDGAVEIFVSVARVVQNGITLKSVESLVPTATTLNEVDNITHGTCANLLNPTTRTQTINGVTFTNNGNGTYTVNGTASDAIWYQLTNQFTDLDLSRKYKIVGCPQGGSSNSYMLYDDKNATYKDYGNGVIYTPKNQPKLYIQIKGGTTCNNLIFKPMLTTDLNAKYSDYVPYTGNSGRLNEDVAEMNGAISQINSELTYKCPKKYTEYPPTSAGWSQCVSECEDIVVIVGFTSEYGNPCIINIPVVADFVRTENALNMLIYDAQYKATLKISSTIFNPSFEINGTSATAYYHIYGR